MINKNIVVFAKEKPGLTDIVCYLRRNFVNVKIFKGCVGDAFPNKAFVNKYDICISYMSPWVIPHKLLLTIKDFAINFHPGPPEYRGIGCTNFAIYNNASKYGVTAHLMDTQVDSGKIIKVSYFPILLEDTLLELTQKCYKQLLGLFYDVFDYYCKNVELPKCNKKWSKRLYTRKELNDLCRIQKGMSRIEVKKRVKATNFPNMPKAYIQMFGCRFEYKE
jgi:methionyl-tRNA formyltransferase